MPELHTLLIFSTAVLGLLLVPGPNMAFLFAHSLAHGPRGGLAVAVGILVADLVLSALTAAGITAVLIALPGAFDAIRIAGALYLLGLALQCVQARRPAAGNVAVDGHWGRVLRRAAVNSLFNPKALLFFMVFLPQFVDPGVGPVAMQLAILGLLLSIEALAFHALLGISSGFLAHRMTTPRVQHVLVRVQGAIFLGLAVRLLLIDPSAPAWRPDAG